MWEGLAGLLRKTTLATCLILAGRTPKMVDSSARFDTAPPMQQAQLRFGRLFLSCVKAVGDVRVSSISRASLLLLPVLLGSVIVGTGSQRPSDLKAFIRRGGDEFATADWRPLPRAEPLTFERLAPEDARRANLQTPFVSSVGPAAPAFILLGTPLSRMRAVDCLASAMWYEAGNTDLGQRAVGQVILNRVRHPAFPNSVCGVIFQGAERRTGCQFTFTCDGALRRRPSQRDLALARMRAELMLSGGVVPQVGLATHYHTDWVHPVWSSAMDKLTLIETHLFFRWAGAWGKPAAFRQRYSQVEPAIGLLAQLSEAHNSSANADPSMLALVGDENLPNDARPSMAAVPAREMAGAAKALTIAMMAGGDGSRQSYQALGKCSGRNACKVFGYVDGRPDSLAFLYVRDRRSGWTEIMLWDCTVFPRAKAGECLSAASQRWIDYPV